MPRRLTVGEKLELEERLRRIIDATFMFPHSSEHGECPRCIIYTEARAALDEHRNRRAAQEERKP